MSELAVALKKIEELEAELVALKKRDRLLSALEAGGVDNWQWYSESIRDHYPEYFDEL